MEKEREDNIIAIKEMLNQYAAGCNTGDFDLWISLWADDGIQMPPDTPTRIGKEQIQEGMKPIFDQMNLDIVIHNIEDAKVYGNLGLTRCKYTLKLTPKAVAFHSPVHFWNLVNDNMDCSFRNTQLTKNLRDPRDHMLRSVFRNTFPSFDFNNWHELLKRGTQI
jgi:ketosteroid isomerase-like protein